MTATGFNIERTQGYVAGGNGRTPAYSFVINLDGQPIWSGRDFLSPTNREDAIKVAVRELRRQMAARSAALGVVG